MVYCSASCATAREDIQREKQASSLLEHAHSLHPSSVSAWADSGRSANATNPSGCSKNGASTAPTTNCSTSKCECRNRNGSAPIAMIRASSRWSSADLGFPFSSNHVSTHPAVSMIPALYALCVVENCEMPSFLFLPIRLPTSNAHSMLPNRKYNNNQIQSYRSITAPFDSSTSTLDTFSVCTSFRQ